MQSFLLQIYNNTAIKQKTNKKPIYKKYKPKIPQNKKNTIIHIYSKTHKIQRENKQLPKIKKNTIAHNKKTTNTTKIQILHKYNKIFPINTQNKKHQIQ